jgi:TBC1 domain family member 1
LKAYSLFDKEVGYCQGLSFVAAILLLHVSAYCSSLMIISYWLNFLQMSEDEAFEMMKYLMFDLGLRNQYKPDMSELQVSFINS